MGFRLLSERRIKLHLTNCKTPRKRKRQLTVTRPRQLKWLFPWCRYGWFLLTGNLWQCLSFPGAPAGGANSMRNRDWRLSAKRHRHRVKQLCVCVRAINHWTNTMPLLFPVKGNKVSQTASWDVQAQKPHRWCQQTNIFIHIVCQNSDTQFKISKTRVTDDSVFKSLLLLVQPKAKKYYFLCLLTWLMMQLSYNGES